MLLSLLRSHRLREYVWMSPSTSLPEALLKTSSPAPAEGCQWHVVKLESANCHISISCIRLPQPGTALTLSGYPTALTSDQRRWHRVSAETRKTRVFEKERDWLYRHMKYTQKHI